MFKVMIVLGRHPDMPVEAFRRYWVETHGPIATAMPGLVRYTQHHAVPGPAGAPPGHDGIAELWYADEEAWRASRTSPEATAARDDLVNFCDLSRVAYLFVEAIELL
jgi:uncharacterized protein (TIGR02118 family)